MSKIPVKIATGPGVSQPINRTFGKCEFVIADANSVQPLPISAAEFAAVGGSVGFELEDGSGFLELEDGSGFIELES